MRPEELQFVENKREEVFEMQADYPYAIRKFDIRLTRATIAPWHWHEEMEILLLEEGTLIYDTIGEHLILEKGDILFLNANALHQVYVSKAGTYIRYGVHMFRKELIAGMDTRIEKKYVRILRQMHSAEWILIKNADKENPKIRGYLELLVELEQKKTYGYELRSRNILSEIVLLLLERKYDETQNVGEKAEDIQAEQSLTEIRLRQMLLYIQEYYEEHLKLKDIARAANIGERECLRCFQKILHMSPFQYLQEYRVQAACDLLKNSGKKIVDIAMQCGFSSGSYFGKVFRNTIGCTPLEYRKQKHKQTE